MSQERISVRAKIRELEAGITSTQDEDYIEYVPEEIEESEDDFFDEDTKKLQSKHRKQMKENRDKVKERKDRTHRLIARGAIAESFVENAKDMTNDEFKQALSQLIQS